MLKDLVTEPPLVKSRRLILAVPNNLQRFFFFQVKIELYDHLKITTKLTMSITITAN